MNKLSGVILLFIVIVHNVPVDSRKTEPAIIEVLEWLGFTEGLRNNLNTIANDCETGRLSSNVKNRVEYMMSCLNETLQVKMFEDFDTVYSVVISNLCDNIDRLYDSCLVNFTDTFLFCFEEKKANTMNGILKILRARAEYICSKDVSYYDGLIDDKTPECFIEQREVGKCDPDGVLNNTPFEQFVDMATPNSRAKCRRDDEMVSCLYNFLRNSCEIPKFVDFMEGMSFAMRNATPCSSYDYVVIVQ